MWYPFPEKFGLDLYSSPRRFLDRRLPFLRPKEIHKETVSRGGPKEIHKLSVFHGLNIIFPDKNRLQHAFFKITCKRCCACGAQCFCLKTFFNPLDFSQRKRPLCFPTLPEKFIWNPYLFIIIYFILFLLKLVAATAAARLFHHILGTNDYLFLFLVIFTRHAMADSLFFISRKILCRKVTIFLREIVFYFEKFSRDMRWQISYFYFA